MYWVNIPKFFNGTRALFGNAECAVVYHGQSFANGSDVQVGVLVNDNNTESLELTSESTRVTTNTSEGAWIYLAVVMGNGDARVWVSSCSISSWSCMCLHV